MSDNEWSKVDRQTLENYAAGLPRDAPNFGQARTELLRRDRKYAEAQEQSRREHEISLANGEADRDVKRKIFEERLAKEQMDHATKLSQEQIGAARSAASAAKWAAIATALAAVGAIAQAIIAWVK